MVCEPPEIRPETQADLHGLFQSGRAAIVANVGPLIRPLSRTQFENGGVPTPPQLFSHNDQQSIWLASSPEGAQTGWGGGLADAVVGQAAGLARPFTAVSAAGNAVFLSGEAVQPYELSTDGPSTVSQATGAELFGSPTLPPLIDQHLRNIGANATNLFERDLIDLIGRSIDVNESLAGFFDLPVAYSTPFPGTPLGRQLSVIARMISLRGNLQASRQVFFAAVGDFDTHDRQVGRLPELHAEMDAAFMAFQSAMEEIGEGANVTLFTASDFGRTLTVNGDGTDHGWGSPQLVIGGAVNGGAIVGAMPPFDLGHDVDAGRGRLIPTASVDQYAGTLGRWFGLNDAELAAVLPNLASFPESNLGFV